MNRRFTHRQRKLLLWIAGGRCQLCKTPLEACFHADHIMAHARGGKTNINNGQALCADCNLKKGAR